MDLFALINKVGDFKYVAITAGGVTAILQIIKSVSEHYEQLYLKRKLTRYSNLTDICDDNSEEKAFISRLKNQEAFKVATGISTTPNKANFIMKLSQNGIVSINDIRYIHTLFEVSKDDKACSNYSTFDIIACCWSVFMVVFISLFFILLSVPTIQSNTIESLFYFIVICVCYAFFMYAAGDPIRRTIAYRKFKNVLVTNNKWVVKP